MGPQDIFGAVIYAGIAIYLIVAAETVGQARGYIRSHHVDTPTPGCLVRFFGCAMLAAIPGALFAGAVGVWWAGVLLGIACAAGLYVLVNRYMPL